MKKIIIFGGSFNPPHIGHASVIESSLRFFNCDEIWIMPSGERRDKKIGINGKHRIKMLEIIIEELFKDSKIPVKISSLEIDRLQLTTTYETMEILQRDYPKNEFYFVIGEDLLPDIKKWVRGEELFKELNFLVFNKGRGIDKESFPENFYFLNQEVVTNISSTLVRGLVKDGFSGRPYITSGVSEYINKNKLYTDVV